MKPINQVTGTTRPGCPVGFVLAATDLRIGQSRCAAIAIGNYVVATRTCLPAIDREGRSSGHLHMCNMYRMTKAPAEIARLFGARGGASAMRPFREAIGAALQITQPGADGTFFPAENAALHRNLLAAYGPATVAAADRG